MSDVDSPARKPLESLHIHCFRGLVDQQFEQLGRINLLVGNNNAGKTSVLEALCIYSGPLDAVRWVDAPQRVLRYGADELLEVWRWLFPKAAEHTDSDAAQQIRISATGAYPLASLEAECRESEAVRMGASSDSIPEGSPQQRRLDLSIRAYARGEARPYERQFEVWEQQQKIEFPAEKPKGPSISAYFSRPWGYLREREFLNRVLSRATLSGVKSQALDLIQLFDPSITDIEILTPSGSQPRAYLHTTHFAQPVPLRVFGDGIRSVVTISLQLVTATSSASLVLLDEVGNSIHTSMLPSVFRWLSEIGRKRNIQIFATTHSLEVVDALIDAQDAAATIDEDLVVYRMSSVQERKPPQRFAGDLLRRLRQTRGLDVR